MAKVSVIIPCYNHGRYICESVESVLASTFEDYEIIIVNDGSTDIETNNILANFQAPKTRVLTILNQGPAVARNVGIQEASGDYILPLDADDKIAPTYLEKAVAILEAHSDIGIVYCLAELFGVETGLWLIEPFSLPYFVNKNGIFCTALFRKKDWEFVGGYKSEMDEGLEDYEFWISLIEKGRGVYQIPEVLFYYRKHLRSRTSNQENPERMNRLRRKLFEFHTQFFRDNYKHLSLHAKAQLRLFLNQKPPFFWKESNLNYRIYHFGRFSFKRKRKKKSDN